jgi:xanthine dehydrogenase iron-sulfur cluster and FAD-binding subunit A
MAAKALLDQNPRPSPEEVRKALVGNLCRCGTYPKILKAVLSAAGQSLTLPLVVGSYRLSPKGRGRGEGD